MAAGPPTVIYNLKIIMEFLVSIQIGPLPSDEETVAQLYAAESARAAVLADQGILKRLWRVPGQRANWGLWEAKDATALHEALSSLPLFPYMDIEVQSLAQHPSDPLGKA